MKVFSCINLKASQCHEKKIKFVSSTKLLYGLKHAPKAWYKNIDSYLKDRDCVEVMLNIISID
jgi:hypothetical protein